MAKKTVPEPEQQKRGNPGKPAPIKKESKDQSEISTEIPAQKNKGGRPRTATKHRKEFVRECLDKAGGNASIAATMMDCDPSTVYDYLRRWPELRETQRVAKEVIKDVVEASLVNQARSGQNITATIFFLKTQAKDRGYVEGPDITGDIRVRVVYGDEADEKTDKLESEILVKDRDTKKIRKRTRYDQ